MHDSHVTHTKNLAATDKAREAGVFKVSLPPHTTNHFQSLDMAFFGSFGKYYDHALRMWMKEHVGRPMTTWQGAEMFYVAYRKVASVQNAVSGFRKAEESDFAVAMVTYVITEAAQKHNPMPPLTPAVAAPALTAVVMVNAQEHNPTPVLTPVVASPALTAVAMEAVPDLCPPKKETS